MQALAWRLKRSPVAANYGDPLLQARDAGQNLLSQLFNRTDMGCRASLFLSGALVQKNDCLRKIWLWPRSIRRFRRSLTIELLAHVAKSNERPGEAATVMSRVRDLASRQYADQYGAGYASPGSGTDRKLVSGVARLSQESGKALSGTANSARSLDGLAGDLRQAIDQFRIDGAA